MAAFDLMCVQKCVRSGLLLHVHYTEGGSVWLWSWPKSLVLAAVLAFPPPTINILCSPKTCSAMSGLWGGEEGALYSTSQHKNTALLRSPVLQA